MELSKPAQELLKETEGFLEEPCEKQIAQRMVRKRKMTKKSAKTLVNLYLKELLDKEYIKRQSSFTPVYFYKVIKKYDKYTLKESDFYRVGKHKMPKQELIRRYVDGEIEL
jgi:hypothetical protein